MTSSDPPTCAECGKPVPTDSQHQICPACLMAQAMASRTLDAGSADAASPPPSPEEIADKFPQFEITECLGRGGMGVVYKARQKSLNRWVAIKILAPERVGEEKFAERFSREAQTLALLNHPNIVTVYDHGETDGLFYIVMEFVDGVNLRDLLREGKMESAQALTIVPPICEALQYAHDKGIVHRDIKPENLLIDRDGRIKIADFGIASLVGASDESSGTPPYMAPEQGVHTNVDHRADIYALGAVLYEMLTGERPASPLDLPSQKVQLDIRIDDIVLRALSKEPERRYRTANEFRTVVENVTPEQASTTPTPQDSVTESSQRSTIDPRIGRIFGIIVIVVGSINALLALLSLLTLPILGRGFSRGFGWGIERGLGISQSSFASSLPLGDDFTNAAAGIMVLCFIFTFSVSTFCIIGGRHMYLGTSRNWALTGAIACCLTPLWWPVGLLVGIGAIIILIIDHSPGASSDPAFATVDQGPKLSVMAVAAAILVALPLPAMLLLVLIGSIWSK